MPPKKRARLTSPPTVPMPDRVFIPGVDGQHDAPAVLQYLQLRCVSNNRLVSSSGGPFVSVASLVGDGGAASFEYMPLGFATATYQSASDLLQKVEEGHLALDTMLLPRYAASGALTSELGPCTVADVLMSRRPSAR
jgi:hypothetical protein